MATVIKLGVRVVGFLANDRMMYNKISAGIWWFSGMLENEEREREFSGCVLEPGNGKSFI